MTQKGMWIIGYGSLIFKPPPLVSFSVSGTLQGYIRRFWQSSSDHRGTPESPGRVATLVSLEDLKNHDIFKGSVHSYELGNDVASDDFKECTQDVSELKDHDLRVWGVAYYIEPENVDTVREYLDIREQDGYTLHTVNFHVHSVSENNEEAQAIIAALSKAEDGHMYIESSVYIGTIDSQSFIGPESIEATANVIKTSQGPSGDNFSYLKNLSTSVKDLHSDISSVDSYLEMLTRLSTPDVKF